MNTLTLLAIKYIEFMTLVGNAKLEDQYVNLIPKYFIEDIRKIENGKIVIRIREKEGQSMVQVMDNGPGIPPDEYERIFERFYRLGGDRHNSTTTGCGLGLSIVQYIAELHEANLTLDQSEFETGLLFTVTFPAKKQIYDLG